MSNPELEEELSTEFGDIGIDIEGNLPVLEKLTGLCKTFKLTAEDITAQWMTFALKATECTVITEETLDDFEKKQLLKGKKTSNVKKSSAQTPHRKSYTGNNISSLFDEEDTMLGSYATTPESKQSIKRSHITPEQPSNKRFASIDATPISQRFSPASLSTPSLSTPSAKYEARSGKGDVLASYGKGVDNSTQIQWNGQGIQPHIRLYVDNEEDSLKKPYKHMFQKLQDKADVLNEIINNLAEDMKSSLMLDESESVAQTTEEEALFSGRVCCDSVGRLNAKSVVLEGSRETSAGQRIPLDLSEVKNYSLFPGQIISVQGTNKTGATINASGIYKGIRLPFFSAKRKNQTVNEDPFTVQIACGPFSTCDETLSYKPLDDLLSTVTKAAPDVLILLGPFVDSKQPLIEKGEVDDLFEDIFAGCMEKIQRAVHNLSTQVVLVPSQRDVFHEYVYPQPPLIDPLGGGSKDPKKIHMMSDPCTVMINDVCFGLTSTDILFHLGAEEAAAHATRSDRLGRLADHLLLQQSYYPLHPTHEDVNLDYEAFERHAYMPITPDVLVVPSDLRYFVKDVEGCLCMNPGRLVKGQTGGTFIKCLMKPKKSSNANKSSVVDESVAQIIRL